MSSKFKVGDKVVVKRLGKRTPKYIKQAIRLNRYRTVIGVYFDKEQQHNLYSLGSKWGRDDMANWFFRAEELESVVSRSIGRPRQKRKYRLKDTRY